MTPEHVQQIEDPVERAAAAQGYIVRAREAIEAVEQMRDEAIGKMLADGWSVRKVAAELKLSPARVQQVRR
jgi:DNA-binding NarL/FixJ family response regulator